MGRERILALVQAGGQGSRMDVLTRERAKPALPFAGVYQLVDFALSSLAASQIADVWVGVQYQAGSLDPHLAAGRPWDLDRTRGGFRRMVPEQGGGSATGTGFSTGNADNLLRLADDIAAFAPDVLVVMSADHVFSVDLRDVIDTHLARDASCTLVTAEVSKAEAAHNAVVVVNRRGRVTQFQYKPDTPVSTTAATEIFVYNPEILLRTLGELRVRLSASAASGSADDDAADDDSSDNDGSDNHGSGSQLADEDGHGDADSGLGDFGEHLLPRLVKDGRVYAVDIGGYWKDVGRPEAYLQAHRDLLAGRIDVFDQPSRPVLTRFPERLGARIHSTARISGSLIGPGCEIAGEVIDSVLGSGVRVAAGARVQDSVVFDDVVLHAGADVRSSIIDTAVTIGAHAKVGALAVARPLAASRITLVGKDCRIKRRAVIPAGARLEPGTS